MFPLIIPIPILEYAAEYLGDYVLTKMGILYDEEEGIERVDKDIDGLENSVTQGIADLKKGIDGLENSVTQVIAGIDHQTTMLSAIQTSIDGIGMAAGAACSLAAVNVFQLVKVQKSINRLEHQLEDGFADLKSFIAEELQARLDEQKKGHLIEAYVHYTKGVERLKTAVLIQDLQNRKSEINHCRSAFYDSLKVYDNKNEYEGINIAAKLRRLECCWAIESSIAEAYSLQDEYSPALDCYEKLRQRIIDETKSFEIVDENSSFMVSELDWFFNNDMKIINAKIELFKGYLSQGSFTPVKISAANHISNEETFEKISSSTAKLYVDCLLSSDKTDQIKSFVIQEKPRLKDVGYSSYLDFQQLPLIEFCEIYLKLDDQTEKKLPCLENKNEDVNRLFENLFLEKGEISYQIDPNDLKLKGHYKALGRSIDNLPADVSNFHKILNSYINKVKPYLLQNRNIFESIFFESDTSKGLKKFGIEELGFSEKFVNGLNKIITKFYHSKVDEYLREHSIMLLSTFIKENSTKLPDKSETLLCDFEKNLALTEEELLKNRNKAKKHFKTVKNDVILNNKMSRINSKNEVLVWKIQDEFNLPTKDLNIQFLKGCVRSAKEYLNAYNTFSENGKKELSKIDVDSLSKIQERLDIKDNVAAHLRGEESSIIDNYDVLKNIPGKRFFKQYF